MAARFIILGAASVVLTAAVASRRRLTSNKAAHDKQNDAAVSPNTATGSREIVHAFTTVSPPPPPDPATGRSRGSTAILLLSALLSCSAAAVCAARGQWDVAAAVLVACLLLIKVQPTNSLSVDSSTLPATYSVSNVSTEPAPSKLPNLNGTWVKEASLSDSMEPAMTLMRLNGVVRTAVKLVKGVKLHLTEESFVFAVFSVISWFKVTEQYSMSGGISYTKRRDLRRGKARGTVRVTSDGVLRLEYEWDEPHAGQGIDEFKLDSEGKLHVTCTLFVGGQTVCYTQVYRRRGEIAGQAQGQ